MTTPTPAKPTPNGCAPWMWVVLILFIVGFIVHLMTGAPKGGDSYCNPLYDKAVAAGSLSHDPKTGLPYDRVTYCHNIEN